MTALATALVLTVFMAPPLDDKPSFLRAVARPELVESDGDGVADVTLAFAEAIM